MYTKKRFLAFIALFLLVVISAVVISGCGNNDEIQTTKYAVNFIADGNSVQTVETAGNETITLPSAPNKDGYSFDGWFTDNGVWQKAFTSDYLKNQTLTADMSVYAKYSELPPDTFTLSFAGGDGATGDAPPTQTNIAGTEITLPDNSFNKEKHSFLGWSDGENTYNAGDSYTMPSSNTTLTALWNALSWRITFNTDGGNAIAGVWVDKGEKLTKLPVAVKQSYAFDNWYIDPERTEIFYLGDDVTEDIVLYAKYKEVDLVKKTELPQILLEDQESDFSFTVVGDVALTDANYADYVNVDCLSGEIPPLTVTPVSGGFILAPASNKQWTEGGFYSIILHPDLDFAGKGHDLRQYNVKIYKEEVDDVVLRSDIKYRNSSNVAYVSEGIWFVKDTAETLADQLKKDDILCVWDGEVNDDTAFLKVSAVENTTLGQIVYAEIADFNTLYEKFDVYQEDTIALDDYFSDADLSQMAYNIKNGQGVKLLSSMLADNLNKSRTLLSFAGDGFYGGVEPIAHPVVIGVNSLLQGLSVTCSIGNAYNRNFDYYDYYHKKEYEWTTLSVILSYETVIKNSAKLKIDMEIRETILAFRTFSGDIDWPSLFTTPSVSLNCGLKLFSQTDFTLDVLVSSANDDEYTDITGEIQDIIESGEDEKQNIVEKVQDMLAIDGDYIELLNVPIVSQSYLITPSTPILEVSFSIDLVIKMNFAAGIGTSVSVLTGYAVGVSGNSINGFDRYSNSLDNLRYSVDAYAYGYIGVKAGFRVGAYLSFAKFSSLGRIGIYGEVGAYIDIYGYLYFHLEQKEETQTPKVTYTFNGGVYAELGVYVEIGLVAESEFFKARAILPLFEQKWKLLSLGNEFVLMNIKAVNDNTIISREPSFNVITVLKGEFLNVKTGELVERNLTDGGGLCVYGFDRNWQYDNKTGTLSVKQSYLDAGHKLAKTDFNIAYYGSTLQMSVSNSDAYNLKMSMIYADDTLSDDIQELQSTKKATYYVDIEGEKILLGTTILNYGQKPGPNYDYAYYTFDEATHYVTQDYPESVNQPLLEDTVFTIYLKEKQYMVNYTYFNDEGEQVFNYFAVNMSDVPALPAGYDIDNSKRKFAGWELKEFPYGPENLTYATTAQKYSGFFSHRLSLRGKVTDQPITPMGLDDEESAYNYGEGALTLQSYFAYYDYKQYTITVVCGNHADGPVDFNNPSPSLSIYTQQEIWGYEVTIPVFSLISGYELIGWDRGNDGVGKYGTYDYKFGEHLGYNEGDEIYVAVYKHKDCSVTLVDVNGDIVETRSVDYGVSIDSLDILPEVMADVTIDENHYKVFEKWQIEYRYGDTVDYEQGMLIGSACTVRPIYNDYYKVTLDLDGGVCDCKWILSYAYQGNLPEYDAETLKAGENFSGATLMLCIEYPRAFNDLFPNLLKFKSGESEFELKNITITDSTGAENLEIYEKFTITEPTQIKANYTEKVRIYDVTFRTQYGEFDNGEKTTTYKGERAGYDAAMANVSAEIDTEVDGGREYHFREWKLTTSLYEGNVYVYDAVFWNVAARYTVTLDWGIGSFEELPDGDSFVLEHDENLINRLFSGYYVIEPPVSEEYVYEFTGFLINGTDTLLTSATPEFLIKGDMDLTAQFSQNAKVYTITIDPGRGRFSNGSAKPIAVKGEWNSEFTYDLTSVIPSVVSDAAGYTSEFLRWEVVIPQNHATLPSVFDCDYTIVAIFDEPVKSDYILSYYIDGAVTPYTTQSYNYGDEIILPDEPPVKEGYVFGGWSRWDLPVRSPMVYAATKNAGVYGYYIAEQGYKITYKSEGVNVGEDYSASDKIFVPCFFENVVKAGYVFSGWESREVVFDKYNSFIMPPCDVTLNAVWKKGTLTIAKGERSETVTQNPQNADWYSFEQNTNKRIDADGNEIGGEITWGVLTVFTDGLTLSGYANNVAIVIAENVNDFTLSDLTASNDGFSYETHYAALHPSIGEAPEWSNDDSIMRVNHSITNTEPFTLHVKGNNSMYTPTQDGSGITSHRDMKIIGTQNALLNVVSQNSSISSSLCGYQAETGEWQSFEAGYLKIDGLNGSLYSYSNSLHGKTVELSNCNLKIVAQFGKIIEAEDGITIRDCTIKGWGDDFKGALNTSNVVTISGLCDLNITNKQKEAILTLTDIVFDLAAGSRIVLAGGNYQGYTEDGYKDVLDANGIVSTLCWAVSTDENGSIQINNGCKVNGTTDWTTPALASLLPNDFPDFLCICNVEETPYNTVVITYDGNAD